MIDYEILYYIVQWRHNNFDIGIYERYFDTEEETISFIKENKHEWQMFRLLKIQNSPDYTHKWKESLKYE